MAITDVLLGVLTKGSWGVSVCGCLNVVFPLLLESCGLTVFQPDCISSVRLTPLFTFFFFKTVFRVPG